MLYRSRISALKVTGAGALKDIGAGEYKKGALKQNTWGIASYQPVISPKVYARAYRGGFWKRAKQFGFHAPL